MFSSRSVIPSACLRGDAHCQLRTKPPRRCTSSEDRRRRDCGGGQGQGRGEPKRKTMRREVEQDDSGRGLRGRGVGGGRGTRTQTGERKLRRKPRTWQQQHQLASYQNKRHSTSKRRKRNQEDEEAAGWVTEARRSRTVARALCTMSGHRCSTPSSKCPHGTCVPCFLTQTGKRTRALKSDHAHAQAHSRVRLQSLNSDTLSSRQTPLSRPHPKQKEAARERQKPAWEVSTPTPSACPRRGGLQRGRCEKGR
eukprot:3007584-Rhodomonas_salina.4